MFKELASTKEEFIKNFIITTYIQIFTRHIIT